MPDKPKKPKTKRSAKRTNVKESKVVHRGFGFLRADRKRNRDAAIKRDGG